MLKSVPPPGVLYKYCDPCGIDVLARLRLKITHRFNDPFELAPQIEAGMDKAEFGLVIT